MSRQPTLFRTIRILTPLTLLLAGCAEAPAGPADSAEEVAEARQAVETCIAVQRGVSGDVEDSHLAANNGAWPPGAYPWLVTGGGNAARALIKFDLSAVPAQATVTSATVTIFIDWASSTNTMRAHEVLDPWSEATVSYANFWGNQHFSPDAEATFLAGSSVTRTFDLTSLANAWLGGESANNGILLEEDAVGPPGRHQIYGSEGSNIARRPRLDLCYEVSTDECAPNPCQNGGICTDGEDSFTCACPAGWTGATCEVDVDECASGDPCNVETLYLGAFPQGVACTNTPGSYTCECGPFHVGPACDVGCSCIDGAAQANDENTTVVWLYAGLGIIPFDTCLTGPSGTDLLTGDSFVSLGSTSCSVTFSGAPGPEYAMSGDQIAACQKIVDTSIAANGLTCGADHCAPEPCQNGGTCVNGATTYTCECPAGWTGTDCEIDIDECAGGDPCNLGNPAGGPGGLSCTNTPGSYTCQCYPYAAGAACEVVCPCIGDALEAGDTTTAAQWSGLVSADGTATCLTGASSTVISQGSLDHLLSPTTCGTTTSGTTTSEYALQSPAEHAACQALVDHFVAQSGLTCNASVLCDGVVCGGGAACHSAGTCNPATGVCTPGPVLTADTTGQLAHRWTFDEASGSTALDSAGTADGTLGTSASRTTSFDGSGAVTLSPGDPCDMEAAVDFGTAPGAFGTADFSVSYWVATDFSGAGIGDVIGNRTDSTYGNYFSGRLSASGTTSLEVCEDGGGFQYSGFNAAGTINDNTWHNIIYTRAGTLLSIYIDGVLAGTSTSDAPADIQGQSSLRIGRSLPDCGDDNFFAFQARYDDVRTYTRALNQCDIDALANP